MTNSISFSSDLETLFLIEEQQVVAFPLESKRGVVIGRMQGQLIAATQKDIKDKKNVKIDFVDMKKSQVQFYYSDQQKTAFIIIIDIQLDKSPNPKASYNYRALTYDFSNENLIIKRSNNRLHLIRVKNPGKTGSDGSGDV